jgi:rare lipoprotein A
MDFHGRRTANGEIFDMNALTAAHRTLPMPSYAYVTNLENGRTILVRINDRGPYAGDRLIDLSRASSQALGFTGQGLKMVRVRYAGRAPINGDDSRERRYLASQPWAVPQPQFAGRPQFAPSSTPPYAQVPVREASNQGWTAFGYRSSLGRQR